MDNRLFWQCWCRWLRFSYVKLGRYRPKMTLVSSRRYLLLKDAVPTEKKKTMLLSWKWYKSQFFSACIEAVSIFFIIELYKNFSRMCMLVWVYCLFYVTSRCFTSVWSSFWMVFGHWLPFVVQWISQEDGGCKSSFARSKQEAERGRKNSGSCEYHAE